MKERPILFSAPMVRAILAGQKTQTRRVIPVKWSRCLDFEEHNDRVVAVRDCPYGQPGNRLWVRESFLTYPKEITQKKWREGADTWPTVGGEPMVYAADNAYVDLKEFGWIAKPSIHMPRWASRITLEVVSVRVEQINDISPADIEAEGVRMIGISRFGSKLYSVDPDATPEQHYKKGSKSYDTQVMCYWDLWNSINAKRGYGWDMNPWVWVIEFKRVEIK